MRGLDDKMGMRDEEGDEMRDEDNDDRDERYEGMREMRGMRYAGMREMRRGMRGMYPVVVKYSRTYFSYAISNTIYYSKLYRIILRSIGTYNF